MARGLNHVYLLGALTRDPELRYSPSGTPILEFTVAGETEALVSGGELKALPWYLAVKLFGPQAEGFAEARAGQGAFVEAALDYSSWTTETGAKRFRLEVLARRVEATPVPEAALVEDRSGGYRLAGGVNQAVVIGNLTRAPDARSTGSGEAVTALSLAVNEGYKNAQGEWQERTHYLEVTAWRTLADVCAGLEKGDPVFVVGRLVSSSWEDASGAKRHALKLEAERIERLERKARPEAPNRPAPAEDSNRRPATQAEPQARDIRRPSQPRSRAARQR